MAGKRGARTVGTELFPDTISEITDSVLSAMWSGSPISIEYDTRRVVS